jgi:hypothetical protein
MIGKMKHTDVTGIWLRENKTFYYLETLIHSVRNPLDRIKGTLIAQGLLSLSERVGVVHEEPFIKMTWAEAEEKGYKVEVIYLNDHVKKIATKESSTASPWKKK